MKGWGVDEWRTLSGTCSIRERGTIIVTLEEIQAKVTEAQQEIKRGNFKRVQQVIWPEILTMLAQSSEIDWRERQNLEKLIYAALDKASLQGAKPEPIDVERLRKEAEKSPPLVPPSASTWLPY